MNFTFIPEVPWVILRYIHSVHILDPCITLSNNTDMLITWELGENSVFAGVELDF